jgi:hypothetical protein
MRGQTVTKTRKNGSTRADFASITRTHRFAHRRADEIVKNFDPAVRAVDYRKTLAL